MIGGYSRVLNEGEIVYLDYEWAELLKMRSLFESRPVWLNANLDHPLYEERSEELNHLVRMFGKRCDEFAAWAGTHPAAVLATQDRALSSRLSPVPACGGTT